MLEESQLLEHSRIAPSSKITSVTQIALGIIGLGAGVLYFGPSTKCVERAFCGKWLADLTGKNAAIGIFTATGLDFALMNAYFGPKGVQNAFDYLQKQPSFAAKLGKGTFIVIYTSLQGLQTLLASLGTRTESLGANAEVLQTVLTVTGALPGALYGTVGITQNQLPKIHTAVHQLMSHIRNRCIDHLMPMSEVERQAYQRIQQYRREHATLLQIVECKWEYICRHADELDAMGMQGDVLAFLFNQPTAELSNSWLRWSAHKAGQLFGLGLSVGFGLPSVANTFDFVSRYLPTLPLQLLSTAVLYSTSFYTHVKITSHGMSALFNSMLDLAQGRKINSLTFRLRPATTLFALMCITGVSTLSYPVANTLVAKMLQHDESDLRHTIEISAMVGVDIYHFAGLQHLFHLFFSLLTKNQKEQFLFKLEHEIEKIQNMTLDEFIADYEKFNKYTQPSIKVETKNYGTWPTLFSTSLNDLEAGVSADLAARP